MTQNRMHHRDRLRNHINFHISDNEYDLIVQDMKERGFPSMAAYMRAAVREFCGKEIFRERDERKNTIHSPLRKDK